MLKKGLYRSVVLVILLLSLPPYSLAYDVQGSNLSDYIRPYEQEVMELAEAIGLKPFLSYPLENARTAYYWVSENIRYMRDDQRWGKRDYWQLPSTTLKLGTGDCEDQAILLTSLLRSLRLPRDNVRLVTAQIINSESGHAWVEIKVPLPIYGLETAVANALELLKNKKIDVSIGDFNFTRDITSNTIDEIKMEGLSRREGWIPLDPTAKIFGYPIPFSWWLTYGYNLYNIFGLKIDFKTLRVYQDRVRIWSAYKEIKNGESISFEVPCMCGDQILGVVKAKNTLKEQVLSIQPVSGWYNVVFGPCLIRARESLRFEWSADRSISAFILNQADWNNWAKLGTPPSYRTRKTAQEGYVQYTTKYSDNFYVVVCHWQSFVIYTYTIKRLWQETACNVKVLVNNPEGKSITTVSITRREVEKRFDFVAEKSGVYKVILKNVGQSATIYIRLEEYSTPLSPEIAGVSKNLKLAEQEYINKFVEVIEKNAKALFIIPLESIYAILLTSIIAIVSVIILIRRKIAGHNVISRKMHV